MKVPLSARLLACCNYVNQGDRVADIGCDHGYLGIHLLKTGVAQSVIGADINEQPLHSATVNALKFGVRDRMRFFLSNGAVSIPRDFDTMVCAGMGADTMISILTAAPWLKSEQYRLILQCQSKTPMLRRWLAGEGWSIRRETLAKDGKFVYSVMEVCFGASGIPAPWLKSDQYRLVLQCQSKTPMLRRWLWEQGWYIHRETLAKDGKFVYSVMEVCYFPSKVSAPWEYYISKALLQDASPLLPEYYDRIRQGLRLNVEGLRRCGSEELPEQEEILSQLEALEGQINGNGS